MVQVLLKGTEATLDAAVLPRTVRLGGLVLDAQSAQSELKFPRLEHGLVVGADVGGGAGDFHGVADMLAKGCGILSFQWFQSQQPPGAVLDDAQDGVAVAGLVGFTRDVQAPDLVMRWIEGGVLSWDGRRVVERRPWRVADCRSADEVFRIGAGRRGISV